MPALTWQTHPTRGHPNGVQYLSARFSLPRQRWGHNARLPASQVDVFAGLGTAAEAIYRATGIVFNPLTANVTEVHYSMDFHVGTEFVRPILDRLELRQLPRHNLIRYDHGVEFKQKQSTTQIYAKFIQVMMEIKKGSILQEHHTDALDASEGVLRVEHRQALPAVERMQKRHGLTRIAADVLTPDASHRIIAEALEKLHFEEAVNNAESDQPLDRLMECHGVRTAIRLVGFLSIVNSYGRDFWRVLKYPKRTYYDNLRLCKAAGVWAIDE